MTDPQRNILVQRLLLVANTNYELPHKAVTNVVNEIKCHRATTSRVWNDAMRQLKEIDIYDVSSKKRGIVGQKMKNWDDEFLKSIPQKYRTTIRNFAHALGVSTTVIVRILVKEQ